MATVHIGHATYELDVTLVSQNVAGNFSTVNVHLYANADSGWSGFASGIGFSVSSYGSSSFSFNGSSVDILNQTFNVNHNADGTYGTLTVTSHTNDTGTSTFSGPTDMSQGLAIPTIPRASTCSFTPNPMVAGSSVTINTNRASTSFTHTIAYAFGTASGTIATGVGASVAWTPPLSLLNQIPNNASGTGTLTTTTYSGSTVIGTTTTGFTLSAPASVVPTIGSVTCSEATAAVASAVGAYVQGVSTLALAITSAAGVYGSTIKSYRLTVDTQTINASSGTTTAIASAGSLTVTGTVTDSRGRTASMTLPITVLPYAPPSITSALVAQRAYSDGSLHNDGTYLNEAFGATVTSLKPSTTEKNDLHYRISTRQHGTTAWTVAANIDSGAITFSGSYTVGSTYDDAHSWDVLVEVYDLFATTAMQTTVATSIIFQHWDGSAGMGIGKYRENGMLDVAGQIYQNNGFQVLDTRNLAQHGVVTAEVYGTGYSVKLDGSGTVLTGVRSMAKTPVWVGQSVTVEPDSLGGWIIVGRRSPQRSKITSALSGGRSYGAGFSEPYGYLTSDGIAALQGLFVPSSSAISAGTTLFTLPSWLCPDIPSGNYIAFSVNVSDTVGMLLVYGNGQVVTAVAITASNYVSLSGISYPTAAAGLTWTNVAAQGSSGVPAFANGWISRASVAPTATVPRWALDSYGCLWVQGQVQNPAVPTTNTAIIALPSSLTPASQMIHPVVGNGGLFGLVYTDNGTSGHIPAGVNYNSASAMGAGGYQDLGSLCIPTAANTLSWNLPSIANVGGWITYGAINTTPQWAARRELVLMQGLVSTGTVGSAFNYVPNALQISAALGGSNGLIQNRPSNGARGRLDIWPNGAVIPQQGNTAWFSFDGFTYVAE